MKILKIDYSFNYKSLDIYVAGCKGKPHCEGCHNPSSWDFDQGIELKEAYFIMDRYISEADCMIDNIMLFGGEWLDQDLDVVESFLKNIKKYKKRIWLFTRFDIVFIHGFIKNNCDYIKTGRYKPELTVDDNIQFGIKLSTSNQKIYKLF